jgi:hypothetical protein
LHTIYKLILSKDEIVLKINFFRANTNSLICPVKALLCTTFNHCIMKVGGKGSIIVEPNASVVLGVTT